MRKPLTVIVLLTAWAVAPLPPPPAQAVTAGTFAHNVDQNYTDMETDWQFNPGEWMSLSVDRDSVINRANYCVKVTDLQGGHEHVSCYRNFTKSFGPLRLGYNRRGYVAKVALFGRRSDGLIHFEHLAGSVQTSNDADPPPQAERCPRTRPIC